MAIFLSLGLELRDFHLGLCVLITFSLWSNEQSPLPSGSRGLYPFLIFFCLRKICFRQVLFCGTCSCQLSRFRLTATAVRSLSSIPSPAGSRGKEEGSPEFIIPRSAGGWASHWCSIPWHGTCSPGNSEVSGLFVCSAAALISPNRTQLNVNLSFTKDYRNPP